MGQALLLLALALAAVPALGQEAQVTATVDSDTVGVNENLQLTITISGRESGEVDAPPRLPRLPGFQVVAGPSVSTQFQWINGRSSNSKSFIYTLLADREGKVTIPALDVAVAGKVFRTQPIVVQVVAGGTRPPQQRRRPFDPFGDTDLRPRAPRSEGDVFVMAELDRASAYPGEQVTLSYHLYTQVAVTGVQLQENPALTGFWVEDLQVEPNPPGQRRVVNGKEYLDYVIKKQALFPTAGGKLHIPVSTFAVSVKTAGDFFGLFGQPETVYRKTREAALEVKPLPAAGRPDDFTNAVGSFNLTSSLDRQQAATGEAVSLRLKLSGRGNLKMITDIPMPPLSDFTIYSSKRADNVRPFEADMIGGDKSWEYVIVPRAPGPQTIPSFTFSYFDPAEGRYETLKTPELSLQVARGADATGAVTGLSGMNKQTLTRQGTDIHFIKLSADLEGPGGPVLGSIGYWLAAVLALSFSVGSFLYERGRARDSSNVVLGRRRRARRAALGRLRAAETHARGDARRFYDAAAGALAGYLADRFALPEIAQTGDTLERTLAERAVDPAAVQEIVAVMTECDFSRFVSASADAAKMRAMSGRIRRIVDQLERA